MHWDQQTGGEVICLSFLDVRDRVVPVQVVDVNGVGIVEQKVSSLMEEAEPEVVIGKIASTKRDVRSRRLDVASHSTSGTSRRCAQQDNGYTHGCAVRDQTRDESPWITDSRQPSQFGQQLSERLTVPWRAGQLCGISLRLAQPSRSGVHIQAASV